MAGFTDDSNSESIVFADNVNFETGNTLPKDGQFTTDGQLLIGSTVAPHIRVNTLTAGAGISITNASGSITIASSGGSTNVDTFDVDVGSDVLPTAAGIVTVTGTSIFSDGSTSNTLTLNVEATENTFMYGQGSDTNVAELGPLTNGELIIGSTGAAPVAGSLTAPAAGITISGGAGSITFALADDLAALEGLSGTGYVVRTASDTYAERTFQAGTGVSLTNADGVSGNTTINATGGGFTWNDVTGTSDTFVASNGYITNNAGLVTITLPATCAVGDTFRIAGLGAGGWKVAQNASQLIHFGNMDTTTGTGGSLASTNRYDCVEFLCVVTNNEYLVLSSVGNITVT